MLGVSLGTVQVCGVVTAQLKREADWEKQLQNNFLDWEANVLRHLESRKADLTSVSESLRNSSSVRVWYLPHHGMVNPNRPEKVRVVYDASTEFRGMSLNKTLLKGPALLVS